MRQVWAATQVHLHRPCSPTNQQSRVVMIGCCCQRHTYTHSHWSTNSYNTEGHLHAHSQTYHYRHFASAILAFSLCRSLPDDHSDIFTPSLGSFSYYLPGQHIRNKLKQQLCGYISSSQPVCKPVDLLSSGSDQRSTNPSKQRMYKKNIFCDDVGRVVLLFDG